MRFVCLDFETANSDPASACSFGLTVFENGIPVLAEEQLLLPHRTCRWFNPFNVSIHGITPQTVRGAPEFPDILPHFRSVLESGRVIAHNAAFDIGVLCALCRRYDEPPPEIEYFCTCKAARRFWRDLPNHRLDTLCRHIGHTFNHHQAGADAEAAGRVYLAMMQEADCSEPEDFDSYIAIRPGRLSVAGHLLCKALPARRK